MSYLLDALRKSEAERDRARTPDLSTDHGTARRRDARRPWVALLVGGALTANAVVLGVWLTTRDAPTPAAAIDPPAASATGSAPAAPPATAAGTRPGAGTGTNPGSTTTIDAGDPARPDRSPGPARTEATRAAPEPLPEAAPEPAPTPPVVADVRDLPPSVRARIPALEFSTHIYAAEARYREVGINGRRYAEGTQVAGMRLVEITETGVVFELEGRRFAIGVVDDWDY